jgi:thioredoxin-related protein
MKKLFISILSLVVLFTACQSNNSEKTATDTDAPDTNIVPASQQYCYKYIKDKDTATLTMMSSGTITTGELKYNLYEKDKNSGIFEGELKGDTLLAEYTFNSEGKESVRQVAFLKKGNQLVEGFGDVEEKNGKMLFKDKSKLTFGNSIVFNKVECY